MEDTTKTQKKPYTPPAMGVVTTMKPVKLLCDSCGSGDDNEHEGEFG